MPEKETIERAHEDAREGKSPSTQAGEFVREEMHQARCRLTAAGDRHRPLQGSECRGEIAAATPR